MVRWRDGDVWQVRKAGLNDGLVASICCLDHAEDPWFGDDDEGGCGVSGDNYTSSGHPA